MPNEIYKFLKENNLTTKSEADFEKEYSNREKANELHNFMVQNNLTQKTSDDFYTAYFKKKVQTSAPVGVAGAALSAAAQKPVGGKPAQASPPQPPTSQQGVPSTSRLTSVSGVGTGSKDLGVTAGAINLMPKTPGQFVAKSVDTGQKYEAPKTLAEKALAPQGPQGVRINALKAYNTQKEEVKRQIDENQDLKNLQQQKTFLEGRLNEIASEKLKRGEQTFDDDPEYADLQNRLSELNDRIGFEKLSAEYQLKIKTIPEVVSYMQAGGNRVISGLTNFLLKGPGYLMSSDNDLAETISWVVMPGAKAAWELFKPKNAQPKDNPLYQLGTIIDDWRERHHHVNPLVLDKFSYQLTTALTGDLPLFGAVGAFGGPGAVSVLGAMENGISEYESAKEKVFDANYLTYDDFVNKYGGDNYETRSSAGNTYNELKGQDPEEVGSKMFLISAGIGSLEGLPFVNWLNRFDKRLGGAVTRHFKKRGITDFVEAIERSPINPFLQGIEEGAQETISQVLTNAGANSVYDETRNVLEGVDDAAGVGFGMGFIMGSLGTIGKRLTDRRATATDAEKKEIDKSLALRREYEKRLLNKEPILSQKTLDQKKKIDEINNKLANTEGLNDVQINALKEAKARAESEHNKMFKDDMDRLANEGMISELQQKAEALKDLDPEEAAKFLAEAERLKAEMPVAPEAATSTEAAPEGEGGAAGMAMVRSINELKAEVELMKQGKETPEKAAKIAEFEKEIAEQESLGIDPDKGRVVPAELAPETMPQAAPSAPSPAIDIEAKADIERYFSENTRSTEDSKYNPDLSGEGEIALREQEASLLNMGADRIQAHGLAKGSIGQQFKDLLNILTNGLDSRGGGQLYTAPLVMPESMRAGTGAALGTGGGSAYTDGGFIILARAGVNEIRSINDIGGVLVNQAVADTLPELVNKLKQLFPNLSIDSYSNSPNVISEINAKYDAELAAPQATPATEVTPETAPSVPSPEATQTAEVNRQAVRVFEEISPLLDARKGADVKNKRDINKAISEKIKSNPKADFIYTNWNKLKKQLKFEHEGNCP